MFLLFHKDAGCHFGLRRKTPQQSDMPSLPKATNRSPVKPRASSGEVFACSLGCEREVMSVGSTGNLPSRSCVRTAFSRVQNLEAWRPVLKPSGGLESLSFRVAYSYCSNADSQHDVE